MKLIPEPDFPELQWHPVSKVWYVRKFDAEKGQLYRSTREGRSKAKAKQIALKILSEFLGRPVEGRVCLFKEVSTEVLSLKKTKSKATYESAQNHIVNRLNPYFGNFRIDQVTPATAHDYFSKVRETDPDTKLFNDWKHLVMTMRRAYEKGLTPRPFKVKNPDPKTDADKVYSKKELVRLQRNANPILRLQILIGLKMGMRIGEILLLKTDRLDFETGFIRLKKEDTKTRRARAVPIHPRVLRLLKRHVGTLKGTALFPCPTDPNKSVGRQGNKRAWATCKRNAKVKGRFHDLRHTCATRTAETGMNPLLAARILGMDLEIYDKVYCKPKEESLSKAMAEFAKRGD